MTQKTQDLLCQGASQQHPGELGERRGKGKQNYHPGTAPQGMPGNDQAHAWSLVQMEVQKTCSVLGIRPLSLRSPPLKVLPSYNCSLGETQIRVKTRCFHSWLTLGVG